MAGHATLTIAGTPEKSPMGHMEWAEMAINGPEWQKRPLFRSRDPKKPIGSLGAVRDWEKPKPTFHVLGPLFDQKTPFLGIFLGPAPGSRSTWFLMAFFLQFSRQDCVFRPKKCLFSLETPLFRPFFLLRRHHRFGRGKGVFLLFRGGQNGPKKGPFFDQKTTPFST